MDIDQQERLDGFVNTYTGINVKNKDVLSRAYFSKNSEISKEELDALYEQNGIASKIVDKIVEDAFYKSWTVEKLLINKDEADEEKSNNADFINKIDKRSTQLNVHELLENACKMSRVHGGSALVVGALDGKSPEEPLDLKNINQISFFTLLEKNEISVKKYYDESNIQKYGTPELYSFINGSAVGSQKNISIHESRVIPFYGNRTSKQSIAQNNGFGISVLEKAYEAIRDYEQIIRSIYYLIDRSNQPVFKIEGLFDMLAQEDQTSTNKFLKRIQWVNLGKGQLNAVVLDKNESFEYASANLSGLENIIDRITYRISVAADMPLTLLFGTSPDGMNNTGQSDKINWNKKVDAYRVRSVQPQLERIIQMIAADQGDKNPESYYITWPSLIDTTPEQDAAFKNAVIDRDIKCINASIVTPEEVTQTRLVENNWTGDIAVDMEVRKIVDGYQAEEDEEEKDRQPDKQNDLDNKSFKDEQSQGNQEENNVNSGKPNNANVNEAQPFIPNGAQSESMLNVIKYVANREISREAGIQALATILGISAQEANIKMADVGKTFFSSKEINEPV